jgi:hypothetical protein
MALNVTIRARRKFFYEGKIGIDYAFCSAIGSDIFPTYTVFSKRRFLAVWFCCSFRFKLD